MKNEHSEQKYWAKYEFEVRKQGHVMPLEQYLRLSLWLCVAPYWAALLEGKPSNVNSFMGSNSVRCPKIAKGFMFVLHTPGYVLLWMKHMQIAALSETTAQWGFKTQVWWYFLYFPYCQQINNKLILVLPSIFCEAKAWWTVQKLLTTQWWTTLLHLPLLLWTWVL